MSPSNFALTNPQVLKATVDSRGGNLLTGLRHMLDDMKAGQMTHVAKGHFGLGATSPLRLVRSSTKPRSTS
jgi:polyhydroxyalkanoate synthase